MRFLAKGITVARTADDLARYHGKMMLVDRKELFVLAHNFTHLDIERSRSFGIVTKNPKLVREAAILFDCDCKRQPYKPRSSRLIVSPVNARQRLAAFLKRTKRELLIYDIKISDRPMIRILEERARAGVEVRIIGQMAPNKQLTARRLQRLRLHARVIIRDGKEAFMGSQSLRRVELDERREVGMILGAAKIVNAMRAVFEDDWKAATSEKAGALKMAITPSRNGNAKAIAKTAIKKLPVAPVAKQVIEVIDKATGADLNGGAVKRTVERVVRAALKKAVKKAANEVVENHVA
jgi:cardiolipin synthase